VCTDRPIRGAPEHFRVVRRSPGRAAERPIVLGGELVAGHATHGRGAGSWDTLNVYGGTSGQVSGGVKVREKFGEPFVVGRCR
jgi:hypothetical protein